MQNPLRAVSQKNEDSLLESLRASADQYGAGMTTVASLASRKLVAVSVDGTLEHYRKKGFFKNKFLLAIVDGHYSRSCI